MIERILDRVVTKRGVLAIGIFFAILFVLFILPRLFGLCDEYSSGCRDPYYYKAIAILWAPFLLVMSLALYPLSNKIFKTWILFTIPWIVGSTIVVLLTPPVINMYEPDYKGILPLSLSAIYLLISLLIIIVRSIQLRLENK